MAYAQVSKSGFNLKCELLLSLSSNPATTDLRSLAGDFHLNRMPKQVPMRCNTIVCLQCMCVCVCICVWVTLAGKHIAFKSLCWLYFPQRPLCRATQCVHLAAVVQPISYLSNLPLTIQLKTDSTGPLWPASTCSKYTVQLLTPASAAPLLLPPCTEL